MGVSISALPRGERPRERICSLGAGALSDAELLALLLRHGMPGESALDMASRLLATHGGLRGLAQVRPEELTRHPGVGAAKATALVAAFTIGRRAAEAVQDAAQLHNASDLVAASRAMLTDQQRERVVVLICDARNRLKQRVVVAEGAIDRSPLPVREVLNAVLRHDGRAFAVAHNHPSGDPEPSLADRRATAALMDAARTVGLRFLDHIVVAGDAWASATPIRRTPR